jgi:hypothetical protein
MNQIEVSPLELRHRMSLFPSPLKSPVSAGVQLGGTIPKSVDDRICIWIPFTDISQIEVSPSVLCQRMSLLPPTRLSNEQSRVCRWGRTSRVPSPGSRTPGLGESRSGTYNCVFVAQSQPTLTGVPKPPFGSCGV